MNIGYCPRVSFLGTMFTTDLDGTMLIPANEHMKMDVERRLYCPNSIQKTEAAVNKNNIDTVLLNTGRNFTELKEVQDLLEQTNMPVTAISLEDGKRLLNKPDDMTPRQWMRSLFDNNINYLKFKDDGWTKKNEAPLKAIGEFLTKEKGFIHRNDNGEKMIYSKPIEEGDTGVSSASEGAIWTVTLVPPGIDFEVNTRDAKEGDIIDVEAFNEEISSEIEEMLKQKGFDIENSKTKEKVTYINSIGRNDVTKGSVADYVRDKQGDDTKEIRAGNAYNDVSMLQTRNPNIQSIQVGNDLTLKNALQGYQNVTYVPTGELGSGINQAYNRLNLTA